MKIKGDFETRTVWVNGRKLYPDLSQKVVNHSPDGFSWGYGGSGPAQLALALLLMVTSEESADKLHQTFKWEKITTLPQGDFEVEFDPCAWVMLQGARVDRSNWEMSLSGKEVSEGSGRHCTRGWAIRCSNATSDSCTCECGGANHGKAVA